MKWMLLIWLGGHLSVFDGYPDLATCKSAATLIDIQHIGAHAFCIPAPEGVWLVD